MHDHRQWFRYLVAAFLFTGCAAQNGQGGATVTPTRVPIILENLAITAGQTLFVPAYAEVHYAEDGRTIELAVTLTIHNTDFQQSIVVTSVRYYDTQGQFVKEYLAEPLRLGPLASTDFFLGAGEQPGGIGTNFIVEWVAETAVHEPVVEALMLSTSGTQGISFTSPGRVISRR